MILSMNISVKRYRLRSNKGFNNNRYKDNDINDDEIMKVMKGIKFIYKFCQTYKMFKHIKCLKKKN